MRIAGVHHYNATEEQMQEAIEIQWGSDLSAKELAEARSAIREHFDNLYLIELESEQPLTSRFRWDVVTQKVPGTPREDWQAPYDEQKLDDLGTRWAFFFHFLDLKVPLTTTVGELILPEPTPMPKHLAEIKYELP